MSPGTKQTVLFVVSISVWLHREVPDPTVLTSLSRVGRAVSAGASSYGVILEFVNVPQSAQGLCSQTHSIS